MNLTVVVALVAALIGPVIAFFMASRKMSGKIGTSEASSLWEESSKIREDYRNRISTSDERTRRLEERVAKLEQINNDLIRENNSLNEKILSHEGLVAKLEARIDVLEEENTGLKKLVTELTESLQKEKED